MFDFCSSLCEIMFEFGSVASVPFNVRDGPSDVVCSYSVGQAIPVRYDCGFNMRRGKSRVDCISGRGESNQKVKQSENPITR